MAEEYDYLFLVMVVGDSDVGKETLMLRSAKGFSGEDYKMTIGFDFHTKTIEFNTNDGRERCKFLFWHASGRSHFSSIRSRMYRGMDAVLLIFDLTNHISFEHLPDWIHEIREEGQFKRLILLVGNKSDLIDQRVVSKEEIDQFNGIHSLKYIEISAKTGDHVEECFFTLLRLILVN